MSDGSRPRVAVVGGGLAGLAAGLACADAGAAVTLFEAKRWLGGLTASFERDGLTIDTGQHVFLRCCTAYREFLREHLTDGRPLRALEAWEGERWNPAVADAVSDGGREPA